MMEATMTGDSRDRPGTLGNEPPDDVAEEQFRSRTTGRDGSPEPKPGGGATPDAGTGKGPDAPGGKDRPPTYRSESGFGQTQS